MKFCFSIDALSPSGRDAWRLLESGNWRNCTYAEPLKDGDARISDKAEAESWINRRLRKDDDTVLAPKEKAGRFDFLMRGIFSHAVLHRLSAAPIPAKAQMQSAVAALEPGTAWLLYLDVAGIFRAVDTGTVSILANLDIAVRGEIASSPDYIGPKAAADEAMMTELYRQFLAGWLDHLRSSNMNLFIPDAEKLKEEAEYTAAIRNWEHEQDN